MANSHSVRHLVYGTLILGILTGCSGLKQLSTHREILDNLAYGKLSNEERLDGLGEELVILLDESLSKATVVGTYKHTQRFLNQNDKALEKLAGDLTVWQSEMNVVQKTTLGTKMLTKSYTRKLITLLPKYKKKIGNKYDQLVFLSQLLNIINPLKKNDPS